MMLKKTMLTSLLFSVVTVFLSCKTSEANIETETKPQTVMFTELTTGTNGGFAEKTNKVITDQNEFIEVWTKAYERYSEALKPPRIDFENKMVVLVAMGMKTSGGYNTEVSKVSENESDIKINVIETSPGSSCATTDVITFPYQIIELNKSDKKVVFDIAQFSFNCD